MRVYVTKVLIRLNDIKKALACVAALFLCWLLNPLCNATSAALIKDLAYYPW